MRIRTSFWRFICLSAVAVALCVPLPWSERTAAQAPVQAPDTIFTGDFITLDASRPRVEALAVKGSRIVAVGSRAEVERLAAASTRTIAIPGVAVPGWADAHVHGPDTSAHPEPGDRLNLRGLTKEQILQKVAEAGAVNAARRRDLRGRMGRGLLQAARVPNRCGSRRGERRAQGDPQSD